MELMENIVMNDSTSSEFNGYLQTTYDFLNECDTAIDGCELLDLLKIKNNNSLLKTEVDRQKDDVNRISNTVNNFEENILNLDYINGNGLVEFLESDDFQGGIIEIQNNQNISIEDIYNFGQNLKDDLDTGDSLNNNYIGNNSLEDILRNLTSRNNSTSDSEKTNEIEKNT